MAQLSTYADAKRAFDYDKVVMANGSCYVRRMERVAFRSAPELRREYDHTRVLNEAGRPIRFITRWLRDENVPTYNAIDMVPPLLVCPGGTLNLWTPFPLDDGAPYQHDAEGLRVILDYIEMLCSHNPEDVASLIDWMRRIVEQPSIRPARAPALYGPQGCGKSMFARLLSALIGHNKAVHFIPQPFDVQNHTQPFLFVFEEYGGGSDDLRSLMSDDMIRVRLPFVAAFMIRNVTRCLVLSNTEPDTLNGRLFPIRCGDGHIGDQAYFERLNAVMQSPNALRTFWSYLKRRGPWVRVRHRLYLRSIVLYWLDLTKPLMEEGGAAFDHDMAEFEEWGSGVFGWGKKRISKQELLDAPLHGVLVDGVRCHD